MDNSQPLEDSKEPLGEILVKRGKITKDQLNEALVRQAKEHKLLGEMMVSMGFVDEADIVAAVILQCGVSYLAVNKYEINPAIIKLIPESMVRELYVLPVDKEGNCLSVVMPDPLRKEIIVKVSEATGLTIKSFIATKTEIEKAITRYFGSRAG